MVRPERRRARVSAPAIAASAFPFHGRSVARGCPDGVRAGNAVSRLAAIALSSAEAVAAVTAGARRPNTTSRRRSRGDTGAVGARRCSDASAASGIQSRVPGNPPVAPSNDAAATPTTSKGWPDIRIVCPTTAGFAANRLRHSAWLKTTTRAAPASSAGWMVRPIAGETPSVEKYAPSTASAARSSVIEDEATAGENRADADMLLKEVCAARRSRKSAKDIDPVKNSPSYGVTTKTRRSGSRAPGSLRKIESTTQ